MHVLSIRPELVLGIYMASCVSVLIFNIIYIFADRLQNRRLRSKSARYADTLRRQFQLVREGKMAEESHINSLKRWLRRVHRLRVFDRAYEIAAPEYPADAVERYMEQLRGVFLVLAGVYARRDTIEQAYFASLVEKFHIDKGHETYDGLMEMLIGIVTRKDVYARENALKALYSIGNEQAILAVWEAMENEDIVHSQKLLADGLLKYTGDRKSLARRLFDSRKMFSTRRILPIMQFIRFSSAAFHKEFLKLLESETEDKEIRLEAIRYFQKKPYEPARRILQNFVRYSELIDWEYAAVGATALASYPGEDTVYCLKEGLKAGNWYVRLNCANSLIYGLGIPQLDLYDVYNGPDRYAREVLVYASERASIRGQQMELEKEYV